LHGPPHPGAGRMAQTLDLYSPCYCDSEMRVTKIYLFTRVVCSAPSHANGRHGVRRYIDSGHLRTVTDRFRNIGPRRLAEKNRSLTRVRVSSHLPTRRAGMLHSKAPCRKTWLLNACHDVTIHHPRTTPCPPRRPGLCKRGLQLVGSRHQYGVLMPAS
jgi:hypothetical protein